MDYIRQCELRSGNHVTVTWLPDAKAFVGSVVTLRDDDREWTVAIAYERIEKDRLANRNHCIPVTT